MTEVMPLQSQIPASLIAMRGGGTVSAAAAHLSSIEVRGQRKDQQRNPNEDCGKSNNRAETDEPGRRCFAQSRFELPFPHHAGVFLRALVLEFLFALHAGKDHHIHRKAVGPKMRIHKVDGEDEENGEQALLRCESQAPH